MAPDRVICTVDTQAGHTRKLESASRGGFRGHLAAEPQTGLITGCHLTSAAGDAGSDAAVGQAMIARDRFHRPQAQTACPDAPTDELAGRSARRRLGRSSPSPGPAVPPRRLPVTAVRSSPRE